MAKDAYTMEIVVTVPAGRYCYGKDYCCRFVVDMANHPAWYCYLLPTSYRDNHSNPVKFPQCPANSKLPKRFKGEEPDVMKRLAQYRDMMNKERGNDG